MAAILPALAPIFALIALGWALRRFGLLAPGFWAGAETLVYWVLFPCLLFLSVVGAAIDLGQLWPMAVALVATVLVSAGLALFAGRRLGLEAGARASVFQGAIRPNVYVALQLGGAVFGPDGVVLAALGVAVVVPLVNFLSVLAHVTGGEGDRLAQAWRGLRGAAVNPLILAILAGAALNLSGFGVPALVVDILAVSGQAAAPLALLAVGAGLDLTTAVRARVPIATSLALKLVLQPALAAGLCLALGAPLAHAAAALLYMAGPTAPSAFVMARALGGDARLMAGIITASTLTASVTLALAIAAALALAGLNLPA